MRTQAIFLAIILVLFCPSAPAQWVQTNGPFHGEVQCLLASDTTLFAGTGWDGVFLSTNIGTNWTEINGAAAPDTTPHTPLPNTSVEALAVSPAIGGSGTNLFAGTLDAGVFLSTNDGTSWKATNTGLTSLHIYALAVSGTNLFAGTLDRGVFLSTDSGTSWTATGLTSTSIAAFALSGTNLYAAAYIDGVFLSTNNGTSWTAVNEGLTNTSVWSLAVSGTNLVAGTCNDGVFLSTNNGTSWTRASTGLPNMTVYALAASGTNLFAGTDGGVFLSTDSGTSWTAANKGLTNLSVHALAVWGKNLFAGTYGGIFLSTNNGATWTAANEGLPHYYYGYPRVKCFGMSGMNLFAGTLEGGILLSPDNGTNWTQVNPSPTLPLNRGLKSTSVSAFAVSGTNFFAGTRWGGVFLSTNNGTSWTLASTGLPNNGVWSLAVSGTNLFAGTWGGGIFRSTNNGTSWIAVNEGLPKSTPYYPPGQYAPIRCFASSGRNLFVGVDGGVFLSTNNGTNWTPAGLPDEAVYALAFNGTNLFAGTWGGGVFLSTNNGTSWTEVNSGLPPWTFVRSLLVRGSNLFAGTAFLNVSMPGVVPDTLLGVYLSTNNGTSWTSVSSGLPHHMDVYALAASGTNLCAGTGDGCVWRRPLSDMITSVGTAMSGLPREFQLLQNYPNPFNPTTTIQFSIVNSEFTTLKVYDIFGREVAVLVNDKRNAGVHEVKFDGSNLASGVYFYRLRAGDFVSTKRMLILK